MSIIDSGPIPREDELTYWSAAVSGALSVYIMTFGGVFVFGGLVSLGMLLVGTVFASRLKVQKSEEIPTPEELANTSIFSLLALGAFITFTWVLNLIYFVPATQSVAIQTWFGLFTFATAASGSYVAGLIFIGLIIPNSEEQFFRGLIGNAAVGFLGPIFGALAGGAVFAMFHIAVYGLSQLTLAVLALDGSTIIILNVVTGRLLTGLIAHIANNLFSFLLQGSVLGSVLGVYHFPAQAIVPTLIFGFLIVKAMQKQKSNSGVVVTT